MGFDLGFSSSLHHAILCPIFKPTGSCALCLYPFSSISFSLLYIYCCRDLRALAHCYGRIAQPFCYFLWIMASLDDHSSQKLNFSMQDSIHEVSHLRIFEGNGINEDFEPFDTGFDALAFAA